MDSPNQSRPQQLAQAIKCHIIDNAMQAGERLPSEPELMAQYGMSKSTVREAVRLLEAQALVQTRTGPKGGAFVSAPSAEHTQNLLSNYFFFRGLSIDDIYQLRELLEPELAHQLAGELDDEQLKTLYQACLDCAVTPTDEESEQQLHVTSLAFHKLLAQYAKNSLLGFIIGFLDQVLTDVTLQRRLFLPANPKLHQQGYEYQIKLLGALKSGDKAAARQIMAEHMQAAHAQMSR